MKTAPRVFLLTLALTSWAAADLPKKAPLTKYAGLMNNSPFTDKPIPPPPPETVNPLEDLALIGVSPISSGYRVTLLNKKEPEKRIFVSSDDQDSEYKILEVTRKPSEPGKPSNPLDTVVRMQAGKITGSVSFDDKLLVLSAPKAAPKPTGAPVPNMPQPGQQTRPTQPNPMPESSRMPRPRVVPPAPAAAATPSAGASSSQGSQSGRSSRGGRGSYGR